MKNKQLFIDYSRYYDLLYKDKDYNAETSYVTNLINKYKPGSKKILEYGSGTGIHGKLMAKNGFSVFGIEQSAEMIRKANVSISTGFACMEGDVCNYKLKRKFDVVISLFHVISYLNTNEQLISAFNNAFKHLNANGLLIFDIWYTPAVYTQKPSTRVKRIDAEDVDIIRYAEPVIENNKNLVDVNYQIIVLDKTNKTYFEIKETHSMRHFSINEIKLLAELTGFDVINIEEFLTGKKPSDNTWGVCFILKKKN